MSVSMLIVYTCNKYIKNVPANKLVVLQTLQKIYIYECEYCYAYKNVQILLLISK